MALKKSQLYSSLWQSCDELRGGMDASQYKDYVLTLLFMKYVSDKADSDPDSLIEVPRGGGFADMAILKGDKEIGDRINKIIGRLAEANDLKGVIDQADFNDESRLGSGKEMQDRLSRLVAIFEDLDFRANRAENDDLLGDAYEYLMRHFATESGKSKGQFYTPAEVSRVMAQVIGIEEAGSLPEPTVYDPTCGSGSLLIKAADYADTAKLAIYGQEMDVATWSLARMNMILHGHPTADLWRGNTLSAPYFKNKDGSLKTFDFAVANPPFSSKAWSSGLDPEHDVFNRFKAGIPPAKNGDYAFLLHLLASLKSTGKGAIILPHGVLFRGNREAEIRKNIVKRGLIKGIIGLPPNLFYGTGIPACIIVIDKEHASSRTGIFMIDASKGFLKEGNKNRLRSQDIHRIVDVFRRRIEEPRYARMVPLAEIADAANDYNLNIPRYIDSTEPEDIHDIEGHLLGGIPDSDIDALDAHWQVLSGLRQELFEGAGRPGYSRLRLPIAKVRAAILNHDAFTDFGAKVTQIFDGWCAASMPALKGFDKEGHPKALIETLAEDLLTSFHNAPLLDAYDIYQHLMDYWAETMQDDCYQIAADGWVAETHRIVEEIKSGNQRGRTKDRGWTCDLIPKPYVVARYFAKEQAELDGLQAELDVIDAGLTELAEEHGGEEGALQDVSTKSDAKEAYIQALVAVWNEEDKAASRAYRALLDQAEACAEQIRMLADHHVVSALKNDRGKLTLRAVKDRLASTGDSNVAVTLMRYLEADKEQKAATKEAASQLARVEKRYRQRLKTDPLPENLVDLHVTVRYMDLLDEQSALKSKVREADTALDKLAYDKYPQLSVDEIKTLVVDDKWLATLAMALQGELDRVSQALTSRIRELAERYATPLPKLVDEVADLSARVEGHLKKMGVSRR